MRYISDEYAEFDAKTADGDQLRAIVFADPDGSSAVQLMKAMGVFGARMQKAAEYSSQIPIYDNMTGHYTEYGVVEPPVHPVYYAELYRRGGAHRACVDARVAAVTQQGWRIRPRSEVNPYSQPDGGTKPIDPEDLDMDVHDAIVELFDGGQPDYSFSDLLAAVWQDYCVTGNGYVELIRDSSGKLVRFAHAKSVTMRISKPIDGVEGFVQVRGNHRQWFVKYGYDAKSIVMRRKDRGALTHKSKELLDLPPLLVPERFYKAGECPSDLPFVSSDVDDAIAKAKKSDRVAMRVNEMIHFSCPSPKDTPYGEPPILSAIEDYLIAQNVAMFILSYFDNATVPRCAFFVKGDGRLNQNVINVIEKWISSQNKLDALNQIMVLEVPSDTEIQIERLSSEQLKEDSGLLQPRTYSNKRIYIANRTPASIVFDMEGLNRAVSEEADRKFIQFVVRPDQRIIEQKFNAIIKREFGTDEWVLDLNVPDLTIMQERRELWNTLLTKGVLSINEVRRELRLPPIVGGEVPILLVPGQGNVPVSALADPEATQEVLDRGREAMATGNVKTPPRNTPAAKVAVLPSDVSRDLPSHVQLELASFIEQLGVSGEDLRKAFPMAYPGGEDNVNESAT